ncbi:AAA family ATPase [Streptomyces sp. NPDC006458]|uniref:helix-turn-helix transcriptional regulator n=1 Tax=Streptomyces sp. NPDC006458 TaxID=3154302 RepID=UPI0033AF8CD1
MSKVDFSRALASLKRIQIETSEGGCGQLVLVQGGLACGKTTLLHEFAHMATDSGALVLSATGSRTENDLQAGLIDQFFQSRGLPSGIADRARAMTTSAMLAERDGDGPDLRAVLQPGALLAHEAFRVMLQLSQEAPLVITVDDVQFADSVSLQLLLYLLRRMRSVPILTVLTEWDSPRPALSPLRAELTGRPQHVIRLGPLSGRTTAELVGRELGRPVSTTLATAFHDLTGGNPLLLQALVEDHRSAGHPSGTVSDEQDGRHGQDGRLDAESPAVGFAFAGAVASCLHRWEPPVLKVAQGIAVLGNLGEPELIGRCMNIPALDAEWVMHTLTGAGLLLGGRFRHPMAEAAVLGTLSPEERSAAHSRAAELLYQRGVASPEVARHVIATGRVAEPWMLPVLRTASEQAVAEDDTAFAMQCLETALRAAEDPAESLAVTAALARLAWRMNPSAAASCLAPLQAALREGTLGPSGLVSLVRCTLWSGDAEVMTASLRALSDSSALDDPQRYAQLRLAHQWHYGSDRGRFQAHRSAPAIGGEPWSYAANQLAAAGNHKEGSAAVDCAEQILQSCRLDDSTLEVMASAVLVLLSVNKLKEADWWCDQLLEEARRRHAVTWQMLLTSLRARVALRRGRIVVAAAQAEEALALLPEQSWGIQIGCPLSVLIAANTAMGRYDAAAEALQRRVPKAMHDTVHGLRYLHARGHYYLATDRVLAAISDFQRCGRLMQEWGLDAASLVPWRSSLAEANLRLGRPQTARDLVKRQLEQARTMDDRTKGISLRLLGASSDLRQRPTLLRESVECLERSGDRLELARALEDLSEVYQQLEDFDRARLLARRAAQEGKACHVGTESARQAAPGVPAAGGVPAQQRRLAQTAEPPMLSDAQRRVAELAALGHTNQEISRRLYITVSTVEQHLTRVFRKLGVSSRNDLPLSFSDMS